ncbi:MAG: hypothetical protein AAF290_16410 [Pseudomonadota bacterium]
MLRNCLLTIAAATAFMMGISGSAYAGAPTCSTHSSGPFCQYVGTASKAYINDGNIILLYFDTKMDLAQPSGVGITGVTAGFAAGYRITDNPDIAKILYSTMLAGQSLNATVTIQMRGTTAGYVRIDRIWLDEN